MDSTLFYLLVGTGIVSVLTVIYVLVDERARIQAYENRPPAPPQAEPASVKVETVPELISAPAPEVPPTPPEEPDPTA